MTLKKSEQRKYGNVQFVGALPQAGDVGKSLQTAVLAGCGGVVGGG